MNICIYGASSNKIDNKYFEETEKLAYALAKDGHNLVFGAGTNGLMGASARGFTKGNGEVIGIAPTFFDVDGVLYDKCTKFIPTETMRERKKIMEDMADAFIMVPGGLGTFDEFFEIITLKQLARHNKPVVIYDILGYYDKLMEFIDHCIKEGFVREDCRTLYKTLASPEEVIEYLKSYNEPVKLFKNLK
ncbi:MAG: TIGR00730 family Rossman fold protein [Clostridia bacterium]|nr:TIGR00730 family Rossman fold protein [Clostridia bacterium]